MNRIINTSIYLIYIGIALLSIVISFKVSIIVSIMVIIIELIRLAALYSKIYKVVGLIMLLNLSLISYTSYKLDKVTKLNNQTIIKNNQIVTKYVQKSWLRAKTLQSFLNQTKQIKNININYWVIIATYLSLEIILWIFIKELDKKQRQGVKRQQKASKPIVNKAKTNIQQDKLKLVGTYIEYAKNNNISRSKAKQQFKEWQAKGRLIKKERKNYLREV